MAIAQRLQAAELKESEIGVIPSDWHTYLLGDLIVHLKGFPFRARDYSREGVRIIRVSDTTFDSIKETGAIYISTSQAKSFKRWALREDDLILSTVGSKPPMYDSMVGKVVLVNKRNAGSLLNQNAVILRVKESNRALQLILLNTLRTRRYLNFIETIYRGNANQASITLKELFEYQIALPQETEEIERIATVLSDTDALISSLEKLIEKKRNIKQGVMQELLTGKRRLPGFSGEWIKKPLGEICEIVMGQSPSSSNYNINGYGLPLIQGNADIKNRRAIKRIFTTQITKHGRSGDILLSVRAPVGEVATTEFDVCLGRGVCALRSASRFLYYRLIASESEWAKLSKGSTFDSVSSEDVRSFEIELPSDPIEQENIAATISCFDKDIEVHLARLFKCRLLKQALMQTLLTGKIRLTT